MGAKTNQTHFNVWHQSTKHFTAYSNTSLINKQIYHITKSGSLV